MLGCSCRAFETAVEYGYLSTNPARGVTFPQKELNEAPAIIAGPAFAKLLKALDEPARTMVSLIAAGGPLRESKLLRNVLQPAAELAWLGRVTWHQFRHIHSSLLNDLNVPMKIAQEPLGHTSIATTLNIYTNVVDASHRKTIEAVEREFVPNCSQLRRSARTGDPRK